MINSFQDLFQQMKEVPEYVFALQGSLVVLGIGFPLYLGLRYFLYRRRIKVSWGDTLHFFSTFLLFAGLAFLLSSPLASLLPSFVITAYLFVTCVSAAMGVVALLDVFLLQYYLVQIRHVYISPPLRTVIKFSIFVVAFLPILRYVLHFNPLALVAIPTIATAAIALALQDSIKTFIAGVGLGHIVRIGDWISFDGKEGRVITINWARTTIETLESHRVYIPNTLLQKDTFVNHTAGDPVKRLMLKVGVSYAVVPERVKEILRDCAQTTSGVVRSPSPVAPLLEYGESAMVYGLFYWIEDFAQRFRIQDEVLTKVWYAFKREGITIPFPIRTVQLERASEHSRKEQDRVEDELKRWSLAEAFFNEELKELSRSTTYRLFAPREVIFQQGAPGQTLYSIISGQVEVWLKEDPQAPVASLGPRDIFGEMSVLTGDPRAATVIAKTALEVLEIDKPAIQRVMAKRPELSDKLAALVTRRQAFLAQAAARGASRLPSSAPEPQESLSRRIRQFFGLS